MKKLLIIVVQALALVFAPTLASAQQPQRFSDPEIYEKDYFRKECKTAGFGPAFMKRFDINNDGMIDLVSNQSEITCDGVKGPRCTSEGCPYNFYVQIKEGGYVMVATAQLYKYDFVQYFGNMVFELTMHPRFCGRKDAAPCEMRVRVRGLDFNILSKK
ncbi:hypothetical protein [Neorhizobium sp. LjRoot104]|uniref:hypothetical protein n=1 Tax=Neorhizobium sp. LjRoot104 TaxID=3342254 RepID=UPI003ECFC68D